MERTKEQQEAIIERIKLIMKEKSLNQTQFGKEIDMAQAHISSYLSGRLPLTDNFIYPIIFKFRINPLWLEFGENPVYLSPNVEQSNANNGDNNVNMTMPKEAWEMLQSQQKTIESQQDSVKMAQVNMMEIIKAFNK